MKYSVGVFVGFVVGILSTAMVQNVWPDRVYAQSDSQDKLIPGTDVWILPHAYLNAGVDPNHNAAAIHVDTDGYVICSDQKKP